MPSCVSEMIGAKADANSRHQCAREASSQLPRQQKGPEARQGKRDYDQQIVCGNFAEAACERDGYQDGSRRDFPQISEEAKAKWEIDIRIEKRRAVQVEDGMCSIPKGPKKLKVVSRISAQDSVAKMNNGGPSYNDRKDYVEGQRQQLLTVSGLCALVVRQPAHLQDAIVGLCQPIAQIFNLPSQFCDC